MILAPTLYTRQVETDDYIDMYITDTPREGFTVQPGGTLPDGTVRPFMLYSKYAMSIDSSGTPRSVSGAKPANRTVSHNTLITTCDVENTGYSAYNVADDWYIKTMFMMKYGTKNSQSVFQGCTNYTYQYFVSVTESDVNRVILSKSQAQNLIVGSTCSLGTNPDEKVALDRNLANAYSIFDMARITKIEDYDDSNSAVYFEDVPAFTTVENTFLSTMPWYTGCCDNAIGDGYPVAENAKYPFVMQGIELCIGLYEIMGNTIIKNTGDGWKVYVNPDSRNEKTAYNASFYSDTGLVLPGDSADSWKYPTYCKSFNGLISSSTTGGSTTTGMCDGIYTNKLSTTGERQWLSFGYLRNGAVVGLWCVSAFDALSGTNWHVGSRLSLIGRSKG